ncbi:hypothetical protein Tco_0825999 [Tanacetum coccineum]
MSPNPSEKKIPNINSDNGIKLKNLFEKLQDHDDDIVDESLAAWNIRGLNRTPKQSEVPQVVNENQLSVCAILESHVDLSALSKVCSKVFCSWDWTSNASLCPFGCRIIVG